MNKYELQAQADELQKQLNVLTEKIANCKDEEEEPKLFPQEGEEYWYYYTSGIVGNSTASDSNGRLISFRTKEEAQRAADIQWAKQRVAHRIAVLNDGWVPDWNKTDKKFHIFNINPLKDSQFGVDYFLSVKVQPDWMQCKSEEVARQVIDECRNDLLLIFSE